LEVPSGESIRVDRLGRWAAARLSGRLYRRTWEGAVVSYPDPHGWPQEVTDIAAAHRRVRALARRLAQRFGPEAEAVSVSGEGDGRPRRRALLDYLARAGEWTARRYEQQQRAYARAYDEAVEILPPDRTMDLVVLPASGCPNGRCSFCAFYRGRSLRVKSGAAYRSHLSAVSDLFGPALGLRRGVFLGSASAVSLPQDRLLAVLDETRRQLGEFPAGIAAFWDPDHAPRRDEARWLELDQRGLRAVYVGMETGLSELRGALGKTPLIDALIGALRAVRQTAIRLGVIVLCGIGGPQRLVAHREATAAAIERLELRPSDLVFVSPLRGALDPVRLAEEERLLRQAIRQRTVARVVPYAMDAFRYYC
jgi:radical SAM superfamily enzyme YgiQ (UPF0313 family)